MTMFNLKQKTFKVEGRDVTVRELSAAEIFEIDENADKFEIVAKCWVGPGTVSKEDVGKWPLRTVDFIYSVCWELLGIDEGND